MCVEGGRGGGRYYTYRYTVTIRMIPALRWAAMRATFNVSLIVRDKTLSQDSVHKPQHFSRERKPEAVSNRGPSAHQGLILNKLQTSLPSSRHWFDKRINLLISYKLLSPPKLMKRIHFLKIFSKCCVLQQTQD